MMTAAETARKVRARELKAEDAVRASLERIRKRDPQVKAFLSVHEESALEAARAVDRKVAAGEKVGPLAGVPIAVKDNILVKGMPATCASKILENYVAVYDATVTERLRAAGAVIVGKTNMDEFAMGSSTENSAFFPTKNPWDTTRVPGGSSGGSIAAVAAGMVPLALGSETGGSVRQPAAFCGVVGLKPSYGAVSRYGLVAFASSLDQIGPAARTAEDASLLFSVVAGHDPKDSTSLPSPAPAPAAEKMGSLAGLRVGLPKEYFIEGLDPEIAASVRSAVERLGKLGATVREVSLPHTRYALSSYYIIAPSEASANLARFDGVRYGHRSKKAGTLLELYENSRGEGFGAEVKRRIMLGTYALSSGYYDAYYLKAQRVRTLIRRDFEDVFKEVDVLATPTAPTTAFKLGEKSSDPLQMYLSDVFTMPCNMAGIAGLSLPCGLSKGGLPIGLQLLAPSGGEDVLFGVARRIEREIPFECRPAL